MSKDYSGVTKLAGLRGVFARLPFVHIGGFMARKAKKEVKKVEPELESYDDYGDYIAAKKAAEKKE